MSHVFRACWPITDTRTSFITLCRQAQPEVPLLAVQAHARLTGAGRFSVARSAQVPGSGRITEWVLLYEAPALRTPTRTRHLTAAPTEGDTAA